MAPEGMESDRMFQEPEFRETAEYPESMEEMEPEQMKAPEYPEEI